MKVYEKPKVCIDNFAASKQITLGNEGEKLKVSDEMILREIAGENILIPVGKMALKVHGMLSLSESGLLLWEKLHDECTEEDLIDVILKEYTVDRETAAGDVKRFIRQMREVGILIEASEEIK